jgi:ribonuclease VapC
VIVDTSAIVAVLRDEAGAMVYSSLIAASPVTRMSAATYVELSIVIDGLQDARLAGAMDKYLEESGVRIEPLTEKQAVIARTAYQRFGKGSGHPARLNMGDCFAYALARDLGEPLLFRGDDFTRTDIEIVTEPIRHKRLSEIVAAYESGSAGAPPVG